MKENINKQVAYLEYLNREKNFHHHHYDEEMRQYEYIKKGDLRSVEETKRMLTSGTTGHLSDDPLKNQLYLSICNATMCTRAAIEGGMESEKAYNASDIFIRKCDQAKTVEEIIQLHYEMTAYFTREVAAAQKANIYSKPVIQCMEYIQNHLHETIRLKGLAALFKFNASYLSVLFKQETGMAFQEYVILKRLEAAENMLKYSDFSLSEISEILGFSSYSHFAKTFRKYHDTTPKAYRKTHYRKKESSNEQKK